MSITLSLIVLLIIILIVNTIFFKNKSNKQENFSEVNSTLDPTALDRVDEMADKIDSLVEHEQETRTFCKLLRHDSSNKEQLEKVMEHRNKQFEDNWKKQNKMLSEIKKKIIEVRLGKNDKEFADFNTDRNKKREEYEKRKKIMETAKKMIKKPPVVNLTFQNNI